MSEKNRKSKKLLGNTLLALGTVLLAAFAWARYSSNSDSVAGLDAFEQARAEMRSEHATAATVAADLEPPYSQSSVALVVETQASVPAPAPTAKSMEQPRPRSTTLEPVPEPDFSDWSEKRVTEYKESLEAASDLPLAVLSIDHLSIKVPVYNGATDLNLNRGVARIKGTARVGEPSNLGIAGHRDGFFRPLQDIAVGDHIDLDTLSGQTRYRVTDIRIVNPEDVHVLQPTESRTLTLVTCYPFYFVGSAPQRYIVTAEAEPVQVQS